MTRKNILLICAVIFAFAALYGRIDGFNWTPVAAAERAAKK